jgi:O-methyltransferase
MNEIDLCDLKQRLTGFDIQDPPMYGTIFNPESRTRGLDWPTTAFTMIGLERLNNLHGCIENALHDNIPGDLIETGVWRGGACIFMRAVLKAHDVTDRIVWVADSFQGLPSPDPPKELAIPLADVQHNFESYGLLDDQVQFLPGWFEDTLPGPVEQLAVLRLDGDLYTSTIQVLDSLYPKLSSGGYVIIDDYGLQGCKDAVSAYREKNEVTEPIEQIDDYGVFWKKG